MSIENQIDQFDSSETTTQLTFCRFLFIQSVSSITTTGFLWYNILKQVRELKGIS